LAIDQGDPLIRRLKREDYNDSLNVEDRASLMYGLVTAVDGPVRTDRGVLFCRFSDVQQMTRHPSIVMGDPGGEGYKDMGADHPLGPHSRDGADHRRFRKILDPVFSPRAVARFEPAVRILANELIDSFIDAGRVELHDRLAVPLPCKTFLSLLGLPQEDLAELIGYKDGIIRISGRTEEERRQQASAGGQRLREYVRAHLAERERQGTERDDLIDGLLKTESEGHRLEREEIVDVIQLLTIAGLDTVTSSLSCIFAWLARNPDQRRRLVEDPVLIPGAVEELLRTESPVIAGERYAAQDVEINGFQLRAGDRIHAIWGAANLDPDQFPDPLSINIERPANKPIAFAAGPHRCLGSHLARLELRIAVDEFHRRIPDYSLDPDEPPQYMDIGVRSAIRLPIVFRAPQTRQPPGA
jgi:cytochrome P450